MDNKANTITNYFQSTKKVDSISTKRKYSENKENEIKQNPIKTKKPFQPGNLVNIKYQNITSGHQIDSSMKLTSEYWNNRHDKLELQKPNQQSNIFKGVSIYITGYTSDKVSDLELKRLVNIHGGEVRYNLTKSRVTHIICTELSYSKRKSLLKQFKVKDQPILIHPNWILDSIKCSKKLNCSKYLLDTPKNNLLTFFKPNSEESK